MTGSCHLPVRNRIFARRIARIAFGVVLLAGALALVAAAASGSWERGRPPRLSAAQILGYTWFAATVAAGAAYALAAALRLRLARDALFVPSLVVPAAGVALVLPITLHLLVALAIGSRSAAFDEWVEISLVVTGAAHLVFAALCMLRARRLAAGDATMTVAKLLGITVAAVCVPFMVLWFIPPVLVAITALPILPLLHGMRPLIDRERAEIAALPARLPRATIVRRAG